MDSQNKILSLLDLLDLDEEVIDSRLKLIMKKNSFTNEHLSNAIHFLQYKNLINMQEETDCENEEECTFIAKLVTEVHEENIEIVCKIVNTVLSLNKKTIVSNAEHMFQQIMADIVLPSNIDSCTEEESEYKDCSKALLYFKLCDSILEAVIKNREKLSLPFLDTPLENILVTTDEKAKTYFLNHVVPKMFEGVIGYKILDRIWNYVKTNEKSSCGIALEILSSLSDFFLPTNENKGNIKLESTVIFCCEFWNILLNGLMSEEPGLRKKVVYLIKRAIENLTSVKKDISVSTKTCNIFNWTHKDMKILKDNWNKFFILIESLEEKQSNIVLPSLQLFETINYINDCWINCAFKIGLRHNNTQVRTKCIEYRLKTKIETLSDANVFLEALNDINIFDHPIDCEDLKSKTAGALQNGLMLVSILRVIPYINWCPVPLFHLSDVLSNLKLDLSQTIEAKELSKLVMELLKIPCNNIPIRCAVKVNLTHFVGNCCNNLKWYDFVNIYSLLEWDKFLHERLDQNPFVDAIKKLEINPDEKEDFFKTICKAHENIGIVLVYLENHTDDLVYFMEHVVKKVKNIQDINKRQYSNKKECFNDIIFLTYLFEKTRKKDLFKNIANILSTEYWSITNYIINLVHESDVMLSVVEINSLFQGFECMAVIQDEKVNDVLIGMYRHMIIILTNKNIDVGKKLYAISITETVTKHLYGSDKHRIFSLKQILHVMQHVQLNDTANAVDTGRFKNAFHEKSCKIIYMYLDPVYFQEYSDDDDEIEILEEIKPEAVEDNLKDLVEFVLKISECGGYGCLKWILKIMNQILPVILKKNIIKFDTVEFLESMWREIEDLKSNNQYNDCIQEFSRLLIEDSLVKSSEYNNIILSYCNKMIEYGFLKMSTIYRLAVEFNNKVFSEDDGLIIGIFCDILLFSPVPKKDHRIADNVVLQTFQDPKYCLANWKFEYVTYSGIQWSAIDTLSRMSNPEILKTITSLIIKKIEYHLKAKQRYHGNSQTHRLFLIGLQHLLYLPLLNQEMLDSEHDSIWAIDLLGKLPHQPSVKTCLEWYISLYLYVKNIELDQNLVDVFKSKNVPIASQFMILFWTLKHKISIGVNYQAEFEYVMDFLLSHTMGQTFNIRLHAQYLASELYKRSSNVDSSKYAYIFYVIQKTFIESAKDKNFVRLKQDYFVNNFDIISHYTPLFIYYFLPRYYEIGYNEEVDMKYMKILFLCINKTIFKFTPNTDLKKEIYKSRIQDEDILKYKVNREIDRNKTLENSDNLIGTIQKKYTPWKNISEIANSDSGKKKETRGELIIVASLIDKLPNLGGMARTSEVFGVKTYVVDSLRHLQDKTFQGLSVSAERWVNIEEVRPGPPLKQYLIEKKAEGYSIVAAEQTSTSVALHQFKFPEKSLLLLGHEKEGIPCDLLPMMDNCVEIPQQGFVRSLNVHVTAAIFIWEYSRQNVLL